MKLRYLILVVTIGVMFSLGCVAASENITSDASSVDDAPSAIGNNIDMISEDLTDKNTELYAENTSGSSAALSVDVSVKSSFVKNSFNRAGSEVPWTISVTANGGALHNIKANETFSSNLIYLSHNATVGEYNPITGIWSIGELKSYENASLVILTRLKTDGTFKLTSYVSADSNDAYLSNFITTSIKSGSSKVTSNVTKTSDDKKGPQHNSHYASENTDSDIRQVEDEKPAVESSDDESSGIETKSKSDMKSQLISSDDLDSLPSDDTSPLDTIAKTTDSVAREISSTFESIGNSILDIFNPSSGSDDSDSNSSGSPIKAISAHNYAIIPVLIFAVFLIILLPMAVYNKIKS